MATLDKRKQAIDTEQFSVLNPIPPFVSICLRFANISPHEFSKIAQLAADSQNDARLIEMVKKAGDELRISF